MVVGLGPSTDQKSKKEPACNLAIITPIEPAGLWTEKEGSCSGVYSISGLDFANQFFALTT